MTSLGLAADNEEMVVLDLVRRLRAGLQVSRQYSHVHMLYHDERAGAGQIASLDMISFSVSCCFSCRQRLLTSLRSCCLCFNVTPLGYVQAVQELYLSKASADCLLRNSTKPTFRISLFLTRQICWISAALCDTFSSEFPVSCSSSFCVFEISTSTPCCIVTFRTIFSPRKLLDHEAKSVHLCPKSLPLRFVYPSRYAPDINLVETSLGILLEVDIDGEMCVDISHLILEALRDADYQVVDEGLDCAKCSYTLASAVVQFDVDDVSGWVREADGQMCHILHEFP